MIIETCTDVPLLEKMLHAVTAQISRTENSSVDDNGFENLVYEKTILELRLTDLKKLKK